MLSFWFGSLFGSKTPLFFGTNVEREVRSPLRLLKRKASPDRFHCRSLPLATPSVEGCELRLPPALRGCHLPMMRGIAAPFHSFTWPIPPCWNSLFTCCIMLRWVWTRMLLQWHFALLRRMVCRGRTEQDGTLPSIEHWGGSKG